MPKRKLTRLERELKEHNPPPRRVPRMGSYYWPARRKWYAIERRDPSAWIYALPTRHMSGTLKIVAWEENSECAEPWNVGECAAFSARLKAAKRDPSRTENERKQRFRALLDWWWRDQERRNAENVDSDEHPEEEEDSQVGEDGNEGAREKDGGKEIDEDAAGDKGGEDTDWDGDTADAEFEIDNDIYDDTGLGEPAQGSSNPANELSANQDDSNISDLQDNDIGQRVDDEDAIMTDVDNYAPPSPTSASSDSTITYNGANQSTLSNITVAPERGQPAQNRLSLQHHALVLPSTEHVPRGEGIDAAVSIWRLNVGLSLRQSVDRATPQRPTISPLTTPGREHSID